MDAKSGYNTISEKYAAVPKDFHNAHIEIPAIKKIWGDVRGRKVLDVGCASGNHSAILGKKGAIITGVDISEEMIALARRNVPQGSFHVADMKQLPFKDGSFDVVFYGLCLHYEKDLGKVFKEANRVLKKNGRLVLSTHNPVWAGITGKKIIDGKKQRIFNDYFAPKSRTMTLSGVDLTIYPQTISGLLNPLCRRGFCIRRVIEPVPAPGARKYDEENYEQTRNIPAFIIIDAVKSSLR